VDRDGLGDVTEAEAGVGDTQAQIDVLHVHEEARVEAADHLERGAPHEHARRASPRDLVGACVSAQGPPQEHALEGRHPVERVLERRCEDDVARVAPRSRQRAVHRRLQRAVRVDEPREHRAERDVGVERGEQRRYGARRELAVAVRDQHRAAAARGGAGVDRSTEADVVGTLDDAHVRELRRHHRLGAVGRSVVDDDGLDRDAGGRRLEGVETAHEMLTRVPRHDDGGDSGRHGRLPDRTSS